MKRFFYPLVAAVLLCGCGTTKQQHLLLIRATGPGWAVAVREVVRQNRDMEAVFVIVDEALQSCLAAGELEPAQVLAALDRLKVASGLPEWQQDMVEAGVQMTIDAYRVCLEGAVQDEVQRQDYLRTALETLHGAIQTGLALAS